MRLKIRDRMLVMIIGVFLLIFSIGYLYGVQAFPDYYQTVELKRLSNLMEEFEALEGESENTPLDAWETLALQSDALVQIVDRDGNLLYWKGSSGQGMQGMRGQGRGRWDTSEISSDYSGVTTFNNLPGEWLVERHITEKGSIILLQRPMGEVEAAVDAFLTFLQRIFLIGILIGIAAAGWVARNISRPIDRLNRLAKNIANLDFSERFAETRTDEIGELGASINAMSHQLSDTIERLQNELKKEKNLESMRKGFVAKVSHELQTPLAVIQSYVEGLEDGLPETAAERQDYYRVIGSEIQTLSRMARDLTDLSQLESGAFQMRKDRIALKPWLQDIASRFKRIMSEHDMVFDYWMEEDTLEIWADRQRLSQAVFNLLTNARRHTPEKGRIRLEIGSEKDQVLIRVWNQGSSIAIEEVNEVWKGFYRGKKEAERGMGLGLAIVDQIVKAHHGNRSVENRENGVLFTLKFPK